MRVVSTITIVSNSGIGTITESTSTISIILVSTCIVALVSVGVGSTDVTSIENQSCDSVRILEETLSSLYSIG